MPTAGFNELARDYEQPLKVIFYEDDYAFMEVTSYDGMEMVKEDSGDTGGYYLVDRDPKERKNRVFYLRQHDGDFGLVLQYNIKDKKLHDIDLWYTSHKFRGVKANKQPFYPALAETLCRLKDSDLDLSGGITNDWTSDTEGDGTRFLHRDGRFYHSDPVRCAKVQADKEMLELYPDRAERFRMYPDDLRAEDIAANATIIVHEDMPREMLESLAGSPFVTLDVENIDYDVCANMLPGDMKTKDLKAQFEPSQARNVIEKNIAKRMAAKKRLPTYKI